MPSLHDVASGYLELFQDPTDQDISPEALNCLAQVVVNDTIAIQKAACSVVPQVIPDLKPELADSISYNIRNLYKQASQQYWETPEAIFPVFCNEFTDQTSEIQAHIVEITYNSLPAAENFEEEKDTDAREEPEVAPRSTPETAAPRTNWQQQIGRAALQTLSIAGGVAAGIIAGHFFNRRITR